MMKIIEAAFLFHFCAGYKQTLQTVESMNEQNIHFVIPTVIELVLWIHILWKKRRY